jgi:hypothetical protein
MLYGSDQHLPSFSTNWNKRRLSLNENRLRFEEKLLPLGAIFLLAERSANDAAPFLETPHPQDKIVSLVAHSYASSLLDKDLRAREFALLGRLLAVVPVFTLRAHQEPARLGRLCEVIERTLPEPGRQPIPSVSIR